MSNTRIIADTNRFTDAYERAEISANKFATIEHAEALEMSRLRSAKVMESTCTVRMSLEPEAAEFAQIGSSVGQICAPGELGISSCGLAKEISRG
jgi:hypothetical protein